MLPEPFAVSVLRAAAHTLFGRLNRIRWFHCLVMVGLFLLLAGASVAWFLVASYRLIAPDLGTPTAILHQHETGLTLLDRTGQPFFTFYTPPISHFLPLSDIPLVVQQTAMAAEDKDFYTHPGFSPKAIARALWDNYQTQAIVSGGSTINQQLVKYSFLTPEKTLERKYREVILAYELDRVYSKENILEMYLNTVYFGEQAYGIEGAARVYFAKSARNLSLAEAALLIGLLPAPSDLSPISGSHEQAMAAQRDVLAKMAATGFITEEERQAAVAAELVFQPHPDLDRLRSLGSHFAFMVRDELIAAFGEENVAASGWRVTTALDPDWQRFMEQTISDQVGLLASHTVTNGAAIALVPESGEVRALVGSRDWREESFGKFNVTTAPRQPGSSIKPILYAAALEQQAITPASLLHDVPTGYPNLPEPYRPRNYDNRFRGPVLVRRALAQSLNVPAVEVLHAIGIDAMVRKAQTFGISTYTDPVKYGLSLALGAGEVRLIDLVSAYATLGNGGLRSPPKLILEIRDRYGQLVDYPAPAGTLATSPEVAYLLWSILADETARAPVFGKALTISRPAAAKTGTTSDFKDAWTLGFTPQLAIGVWMGNNDGTPMDKIAGALGPAPTWRTLMERYHEGLAVETIAPPSSLVTRRVCATNGLLATSGVPSYDEIFLPGTEPKLFCQTPKPPEEPSASPPSAPAN